MIGPTPHHEDDLDPPRRDAAPIPAALDARRPRLLFAAPVGRDPSDALRRAGALCDVLEADLVVVRLSSSSGGPGRREPRERVLSAGDERILRETRRWCEVTLQDDPPIAVRMVHGETFASALVHATAWSQATFLVVPHTQNGSLVRRIVRDTGVPLLVARPPRGADAVVAATDFSTPRYPVLREAMRVARGLVAPTVFVHNAAPALRSMTSRDGTSAPAPRRRAVDWLSAFSSAEDQLGATCTRIVLSRRSTVGAISEVAALKRADLVVVGTHLCSQDCDDAHHVSVAARVVDRAMGSVLVVPIASPRGDIDTACADDPRRWD